VFVISIIVGHAFCVLCALAAWREITELGLRRRPGACTRTPDLEDETHAKPPRRKERRRVKHHNWSVWGRRTSLDVSQEQDLNKRDKFWKKATHPRRREVTTHAVWLWPRIGSIKLPHKDPRRDTLGIRPSRLNRDFSRSADLANPRNGVKPSAYDPRCL